MCLLSPRVRQNTYTGTTLTHTSRLSQLWITTVTLWEEVNTEFKYGESCLKPQVLFVVNRDKATLTLPLKCRMYEVYLLSGEGGEDEIGIVNGF